ncbi:sphingolipid delta-4 desaturase [Massospora cicadina]|nr:sphingolipid delta-4 desaturase [Massospora cicadina]
MNSPITSFSILLVNCLLTLVNTWLPFPISASFCRYHLIHYAYQETKNKDLGLPMAWENHFIKENSLMKLLWVFCYDGLYVIHGIAMFKPLIFWEYANIAYVLTEHYTFEDVQEMYSYYSILN